MLAVVDELQYAQSIVTLTAATVRRESGISLLPRHLVRPDGQESGVIRVLPFDVHRILSFMTHRVLPSSLTAEHLGPLHKLEGWNFLDAWFRCAEAHSLAWTHGIQHRDPSLDNLMYRHRRDGEYRDRREGKICPVLNDWDLANDASVPQTRTGLARTGTMHFMAIARLESQAWDGHLQHIYRHDLEAFFYILAWVLCCYEDGQRLNPLPPMLDKWTKGDTWISTKCDPETCSASKRAFICKAWPRDSFPTDSWSYEMAALANRIRAFFANMLRQSEPSEQSYDDTFKLQLERRNRAFQLERRNRAFQLERRNRALPPPKEDDKPTEIWEGFCGTVKKALSNSEALSDSDQTHLQDLPPRLASFLPDTQMDTPV